MGCASGQRTRTIHWVWPLLVAVVVGACDNAEPAANTAERPARPPTAVEIVAAVADTVIEEVLATGAIESHQFIELRPEVEGRLTEILAREGGEVRAGTPLFRIDDAELQALVAQLEAERDRAVQSLARTRELIELDASSTADLEEAQANARSQEAQLQLQRVRLERTVVRAPFTGLIGERFVSVGDFITRSTRLTTLQTVNPQRVAFQVPERYAQRLSVGLLVTFTVAAVDREFTGEVDFVDPVVQVPARTIVVKANVSNEDRILRPGMFVEARLATETRPEAVVVPEDAILPIQGTDYIWVVTEDTATRREVVLGVRRPGFVEVRQGIAVGETVVVGGIGRLFEGAPVATTLVVRE